MNIPGYDQNPPDGMQDDSAAADDGQQQEQGDGLRHHEIHEMPDGSAHSTRTNDDGTVEEADHDSFEDACASCGGDDTEDDDGDDGSQDFAGGEDSSMDNVAKSYAHPRK